MKNFKITLFIIFMIACSMQTIRHIYVRCNYDRISVLDKYNEDKTYTYIRNSVSLDSLLIRFDSANSAIKVFEKGKSIHEIDSLRREDDKLYEAESSYRNAIENWEEKENKLHEVIVFWIVGLCLVILGVFLYYKNLKWLGLSLIIPGLIEMIWWSSPDLTLNGATIEFIKFLTVKLILSLVSLALLVSLWLSNKGDKKE